VLAGTIMALAASTVAAQDAPFRRVDGVETDVYVAGHQVTDLDGDGREEIVLLATDGRVRVIGRDDGGKLTAPRGELVLPHPRRSLVSLGTVAGDERVHLFVASPDGVHAYPSVPGGGFAVRPLRLASRARFSLRVGSPRLAPIARELNGDGLTDIVVPTGDSCEIWLRRT
jgi:hypothetical protein